MPADEDVFQRKHHGVAHMQLPCCVGWGHRNHEGLAVGCGSGREETFCLPFSGDFGLEDFRIVGFGQ